MIVLISVNIQLRDELTVTIAYALKRRKPILWRLVTARVSGDEALEAASNMIDLNE